MKLWVFSDLHRDHEEWPAPVVPEADVCVVAGDVGERLFRSLDWLRTHVAVHMPVVYVAGNHDFYRCSAVETLAEARERQSEYDAARVHFLDDRALVLDGVRFLGATLWTDFELTSPDPAPAMDAAGRAMNDYRKIKWSKSPFQRFTPLVSRRLHMRSRRWLEETLAHPFDDRTVVVTHHAPHPGSCMQHEDRPGQGCFEAAAMRALDPAYASDLSGTMLTHRPALWLHGHVHQSLDYLVGTTRVVANPRGYGSENRAFDPQLVVKV